MKLTVSQKNLSAALSIVGRAVSGRTTMPVLSNILLDATGDRLRLSATNREIGINCWIAAEVHEDGATTIPARLLAEYVNSLPPERIGMELATETQTMHLSCARFEANIKGIDAFEFPLLPTYQPESALPDSSTVTGDAYAVDAKQMTETIDSVAFAASADENRPTLTGIETTFDNGKLTMAATDGYRLSVRSCEATMETEKNAVVIPARSLAEVARIADGSVGMINVVIGEKRNQILFSATGGGEWQRVDVVSELIDARFPDYRATVPKSANTTTVISTADLLKAAKVALLFARDNANIIRCQVIPDGSIHGQGKVRLFAASAEMGNNASELPCAIEGDSIEMALDAKFLIDALSHIDTPKVILQTTQPTRPVMIMAGDGADGYQLLMPMHPPKQGA
jgi:DNA polymerase-3 subunit beta